MPIGKPERPVCLVIMTHKDCAGEFFELEDLSKACAEANRYTFFFTSWPLNVYVPTRLMVLIFT